MSGSVRLHTCLSRFLFRYRITPHSTTGSPPTELLMHRNLRSTLNLLRPSVKPTVLISQARQKKAHDMHTKMRQFHLSDQVYVRTSRTPTWLKGFVCEILGPLSYRVQLEDGRVIWRHMDHIRLRTDTQLSTDSDEFNSIPSPTDPPFRPPPPDRPLPHRSERVRHPSDHYVP